MLANGIYALYKGITYEASSNLGMVRLVSRDVEDIKNGFVEKKYPDFYVKKGLPKIYIKEVEKSEVEEVFRVRLQAMYNGEKFHLNTEKDNQYYLGTNDAAVAKQLNFDRTDKYYYEKWVPKREVEVITVKEELK